MHTIIVADLQNILAAVIAADIRFKKIYCIACVIRGRLQSNIKAHTVFQAVRIGNARCKLVRGAVWV